MAVGITTSQSILVASLSVTSCLLSIFGSLSILRLTYRKLKDESPVSRILFQLSMYDIITSISLLFMPFGIPKEYGFEPFSIGNRTTCTTLGLLLRYPTAVAPMSCCLSVYFMLRLVKGWKDYQFWFYEKIVYVVIFFIPIIFVITAIITESINPQLQYNICAYGYYPPGCNNNNDNDNNEDDESSSDDNAEECIRGKYVEEQDLAFMVVIVISTLVGIYGMVRIYWLVRTTYRQTRRTSMNDDTYQRDRNQRVATQAMLYTLAYLNGVFWEVAINIVMATIDMESDKSRTILYVMQCLTYFFFPLQGFLNFITFIYPRINERKSVLPNDTLVRHLLQIVWYGEEMTISKSNELRRAQHIRKSLQNNKNKNKKKNQNQQSQQQQQQQQRTSTTFRTSSSNSSTLLENQCAAAAATTNNDDISVVGESPTTISCYGGGGVVDTTSTVPEPTTMPQCDDGYD